MTQLHTSIECVLFDLDGTLIDTAPDFIAVLNRMLCKHDRPELPPDTIRATVSNGARALISMGFEVQENDAAFPNLLAELLDGYHEELLCTQARIYPGMDLLLEQLDSQGIQWGVVTNKPEKYSLRLFEQLGLLERCKVLVCPDHVENSKPHPEPILLACERFSCDLERTVYLGDHHRDMIAAKNADVIAIAALYGYLSGDDRVEEWGADFLLSEPGNAVDLLNLLIFA